MPFTPEQEQRMREIYAEELKRIFGEFVTPGTYVSHKHFQFMDGRNIQAGRTVGTKIGTAADQLIGFFGKTPVVQQATISPASGGATVDSQARAAVNSVITALQNLGFIA